MSDAPTLHFLVPGDLATRTGGYGYDRRILQGLRQAGWKVEVHALGDGYPFPQAGVMAQADAVMQALPEGAWVLVDGLGFGVLPGLWARHAGRQVLLALVHHPLALETGLSRERSEALRRSEIAALAQARGVIVTSPATALALQDYEVPPDRIAVVEPGVDRAPLFMGSQAQGRPLALLCVASLTPRKGHLWLLEALAHLKDRGFVLHCAGSPHMDTDCAVSIRHAISTLGLQAQVRLHGEQGEAGLDALYAQSDLFVLPSFYEGYGMALTEALARGLPIISTTAGAIPDTVPAAAGLLVEAGDVQALRDALARVMDDADLRARLAEGARVAREQLVGWDERARDFADALLKLAKAPARQA